MDCLPDTRDSLIVRLADPADEAAWREFLEIYRPVIYRTVLRHGLQESDADDVVQQILMAIVEAVGRWQHSGHAGSFRAWLFTITRNLLINFVSRRRQQGVGGTSFAEMLEQEPDNDPASHHHFEEEYRAEVFRWAAAQIRNEFQAKTWEAFWRTAVGGEPIADVARSLRLSVGSVYAARSRIMARLKRKVSEVEQVAE
jgi:RNA polymerase sigma-70 factor (ECF subfamily)